MGSLAPGILSIFIFLVFTNNPASSQLNARSCAELEQYGLPSGIHWIDPDGPSNGIAPFNVTCDMSTGATIFEHSQENRVVVNGYEEPYSYEWVIDYDGLTPDQIGAVVDASDHCVQYIKYECIYSMIRNFAAWYNRHGKRIDSWGGAPKDSGKCMCGVTGTCQYEKAVCNCNLNDGKWREDEGNITDKSDLPVTAIRAGDTGLPFEKAYITLGPLVCWSAPSQAQFISGKSRPRDKAGMPMPRVTKRSITSSDVHVTCDSTTMTVYLDKDLVHERVLPDHFHFSDKVNRNCKGFSHDETRIALSSRYDRCGFTAQEDPQNIIYSNKISCETVHPEDAVITRHICDMQIDVRCELPRRQTLSRLYNPTSAPIEYEEVGYGTFTVELLRYTDNTFTVLHPNDAAPVHLQTPLYYAVKLTSTSDLTLFINHCWSTPSSNPLEDKQYDLIRDGCRSDDTLQMYLDLTPRPKAGFSFKAFKFIGDYSQVYIHCEVIVCITGDLDSRCAQGCQAQGRKRRSLGRMQGSNSQPHIVSQIVGPFLRDNNAKSGVNMEANVESSHSVISGIGAASLCIFIGMMAMYTVMKTRVKKMAFLNRETK